MNKNGPDDFSDQPTCCNFLKTNVFNCLSSKSNSDLNKYNDDYNRSNYDLIQDESITHQDEEHITNLLLIRDHPARIRRRSSVVPSTNSIIEDSFLEEICNHTGDEPDAPADKLSRNDRKSFVRRLSQSSDLSSADLRVIKLRGRADSNGADAISFLGGSRRTSRNTSI